MSRVAQAGRIVITSIRGALSLMALAAWSVLADEGMWTFDNPPSKLLQEKYGFTPTPDWLDHVRLSSVRFNDGGSGSFVSPHGLTLTNHHVALGQLQKISTEQKNYVKDGFLANNHAEELRCPDLELNVLISIEDVTAKVEGAVKPGMSDASALASRKAQIAAIERESLAATGLRSDVISLYSGGEYWLYRYKKYTDIRLVFAPEQQAAFFGGDPDNFTYPRHDLDMALFRVYEDGRPLETPHHLKWNSQGAEEGELVFVAGNPGSTSRLDTLVQVETARDVLLPLTLKRLNRYLDVLRKYSARGVEQAREATKLIFSLENDVKAYSVQLSGLQDKSLVEAKRKQEADFRARVDAKREWKEAYARAWSEIAEAQKKYAARVNELRLASFGIMRMPSDALTIVQYVAEVKKPDGERLDGFHDSGLESLKFTLLSPAPTYPGLEQLLLEDRLTQALAELGPDHPWVKATLNGRVVHEAAREMIAGTKMGDAAFRKSLLEGGEVAVAASGDPMIVMARRVDPVKRANLKWLEDNVQSVETSAGEKIGKARFAAFGKSSYPDATFTLRLSYGTVKGYPMNGTKAPPETTYYGLYDRSVSFGGRPPYDLPPRYRERRDKIDLSTPLDFVNTCDVTGGNSGSPVINRRGEIVGLIFDGNIESLVGDYVYNEQNNRAVAVHTSAMSQALRKLYDAPFVADELEER